MRRPGGQSEAACSERRDHFLRADRDEQREDRESRTLVVQWLRGTAAVHCTRLFRYSSVAARNGTNRLPTMVNVTMITSGPAR